MEHHQQEWILPLLVVSCGMQSHHGPKKEETLDSHVSDKMIYIATVTERPSVINIILIIQIIMIGFGLNWLLQVS